MKAKSMKRHTILSVTMAIVILCMAALSVSAESTPALVEGVAQTGILAGNEAGSFVSYMVQYPGDDAEMTIRLEVSSLDPTYSGQLGFNVYGPWDFTAHGATQDDGTLQVTYCEEDAVELYVQVYNYSTDTFAYSLSVEGLTVKEAEEVIVETVAEPADLPALGSVSGSIIGNTGGAFANHTFTCISTESDVTITMAYSPDDPSVAGALGFEIWDCDGDHVASGAQPGGEDRGILWATFKPEVEGDYTVQVYNYSDGIQMNYTLTASY